MTATTERFQMSNHHASDLDELLGRIQRDEVRNACPVLLIGIGGTGAHVLRRVKDRVNWLGLKDFCRFLILDTDESVRGATGSLPGFDNNEFCYLNMKLARDVIDRPEEHPVLTERLDLGDDSNRVGLANIVTTRARHAGQIRPLGLLALYANYRTFHNRLSKAVAELKSRWKTLEYELSEEQHVKLENRFYAIVVGSVCGGTGAGTLIDVTALLRKELADRQPDIVSFLTLPEVYEDKLRGKPAEYQRIMANAYATIKEIDFFEHQEAMQQRVDLGGSLETRFLAPSGLFERCSFVQRVDAEGFDLQSAEAVYDTLALHIIADVGSTIGGKISAGDANDVARTGLELDPLTHRKRRYSTIGASALAVPFKRLLYYSVYRRLTEFLDHDVLGANPPRPEVEAEVDKWLVAVQLEQRRDREASDFLLDRLKRRAVTGLDGYVNGLFKRKTGQQTLHFGNRQFLSSYDEARQRWKDTHAKKIQNDLASQGESILSSATAEVRKWLFGDVFARRGLRGALAFGMCVDRVFSECADELNRDAKTDIEKAAKWDSNAKQECEGLRGITSRYGTNKTAQDRIALNFRRAIDASVDGEARRVAAWLLTRVGEEVQTMLGEVRQTIESAERQLDHCDRLAKENQPSHGVVTTDSEAEIDVATPGFFDRFYGKHRGDKRELLQSLAQVLGNSEAGSLMAIGRDAAALIELRTLIAQHFIERMQDLNIVGVLEEQLNQKGAEQRLAESRIKRTLAACQPLWQADIGVMDHYFSDMVIVGKPDVDMAQVTEKLNDLIEKEKASLNQDPRYQAEVDLVSTYDPHRIYAVRLSHGGRPHYLVTWEKYKRAYEAWRKKQAHPIHIFAQRDVSKMAALEPIEPGSEADSAFALALAYGWIAKRGANYYFNLKKRNGVGPAVFEAPINSQLDCITFAKMTPREDVASLHILLEKDRFRYGNRDEGDPEIKLGNGRSEALRSFSQSVAKPKLVLEIFDVLRGVAGDDTVSREIESYVDHVSTRVSVKDTNYGQIMREIELLRQQIGQLQNGG